MHRLIDLAAAECHGAAQVYLAGIEKTADEKHDGRIAYRPYYLALVHRVEVVHLHTYVACGTLANEGIDRHVLHVLEG